MAQSVSFTVPTEYSVEQQALQRRRKMAEMLQAQSLQPLETNRMAGGYVVPISPFEGMAKLAQAYVGKQGAKKADAEEKTLASNRQQAMIDTLMDANRIGQGSPMIPEPSEELGGGPGRPAIPGNPQAALARLLSNPDLAPIGAQSMVAQLMPQKNVVVGRSLLNPRDGSVVGVDQTWQQEQEAARQARVEQAAAQREQRMAELQARIDAEERAGRRDIEGRKELAQLVASLRPPPAARGSGTPRAPVGYRFSADGETLEPIPGGPKAQGERPLPTQALKLQQAELDAIGTSASISADLASISRQIQDGALKLGPVSNLMAQGRNIAGISNENSKNFASFQANLERLRNESLRLNKGVQTEGDSQRAWNELIKNINDPGVVQQRIAEIVALNDRAVQLRKMNVDMIRKNYGAGPLDTSGYVNQPAAVGSDRVPPPAAAPVPAQPATPRPAVSNRLRFDANGNPMR